MQNIGPDSGPWRRQDDRPLRMRRKKAVRRVADPRCEKYTDLLGRCKAQGALSTRRAYNAEHGTHRIPHIGPGRRRLRAPLHRRVPVQPVLDLRDHELHRTGRRDDRRRAHGRLCEKPRRLGMGPVQPPVRPGRGADDAFRQQPQRPQPRRHLRGLRAGGRRAGVFCGLVLGELLRHRGVELRRPAAQLRRLHVREHDGRVGASRAPPGRISASR